MNKNMIRSAAVRKVMFYFKSPVGGDRAWAVVAAGPRRCCDGGGTGEGCARRVRSPTVNVSERKQTTYIALARHQQYATTGK